MNRLFQDCYNEAKTHKDSELDYIIFQCLATVDSYGINYHGENNPLYNKLCSRAQTNTLYPDDLSREEKERVAVILKLYVEKVKSIKGS